MKISSFLIGSIAQLGEHLPYKQRVIGSSPIVSTISLFPNREVNKAHFAKAKMSPSKAIFHKVKNESNLTRSVKLRPGSSVG